MFFYDNFSIKFHINIIAKYEVNWNLFPSVEQRRESKRELATENTEKTQEKNFCVFCVKR